MFDRNDMLVALPGSCPELAQMNDDIAIDYLARQDKNDVVTGVTKKSSICCPTAIATATRWPARYA